VNDNHSRIRVLLVDESEPIRRALSGLIGEQPDMEVVDTASTGQEGIRRATEHQPDIIVMDIHLPDINGIQAAGIISSRVPGGAVMMHTSEERIELVQKAISVGVQGYVLKPLGDGVELLQTVRDAHARVLARRQQLDSTKVPLTSYALPKLGERIVVFGPKGGVGKTTVAVGLAIALRQQTRDSVLLFDADFAFGDANIHLDIATDRTIIDLLPHTETLDTHLLDRMTSPHASGIRLLAAPPAPVRADAITERHVRSILAMTGNTYGYVVTDTHAGYDDRMLSVLDLADAYVVVFTPEMGALKGTRQFLEVAGRLGYPLDRMIFVLNRAGDQSRLHLNDITAALGSDRILQIPTMGRELRDSINDGRPLVVAQPRSGFTKAISSLAEQVRAEVKRHRGEPAVST
jgi:pilus assembly protein CpaE